MAEIYHKPPNYAGKFKGQAMVTLSFDDAREDNYRVALPIMEKYGLLSTLHVTTGFVDGTYENWGEKWFSTTGAMTRTELEHWHKLGHEISGHGDKHRNDYEDIKNGIDKLKLWGLTRNGIVDGFASPGSGLTLELLPEMREWFIEFGLTHARSAASAEAITSLDPLNNMSYPPIHNYRLTSQVIKDTTQMSSIVPLVVDAVNNKTWCILMLHSILYPEDGGYGGDGWYFDVQRFEQLCAFLSSFGSDRLLVVTMRDGYSYANGLPDGYNVSLAQNYLADRRGHMRSFSDNVITHY